MSVSVPKALIIADADAAALQRAFQAAGIRAEAIAGVQAVEAQKFEFALRLLESSAFDAIILEVDSGNASRERITKLRQAAGSAFLVAVGDRSTSGDGGEVEGSNRGPDEWLDAGAPPESITRLVALGIERRRLQRELEEITAKLAESEGRFRGVVEGTADGIIIVDGHGRVRFVNRGAEAMFGQGEEQLLGQEFGWALLTGETTELDILQGPGKEPLVAELRVSGTVWEGLSAQVISLRDITDRKRAAERAQRLLLEQAAREQAEESGRRFRFLAEAGVALDASLDPKKTLTNLARLIVPRVADWCVIDLLENEEFRRVVGIHRNASKQALLDELKERYSPSPGSRQPASRVLVTGEPELHRGLVPERLRELAVDAEHARLLRELGTRSSMTVALLTRESCLGAMTFVCGERDYDETDLALAREIASRAARALETAKLYDQAVEASRAKSNFLSVMSHELRTPLNAILGYTDLLLAGVPTEKSDGQEAYLRRIDSGARLLLRMIEEILAYAQADLGNWEADLTCLSIGELIEPVVEMIEPRVTEKGLTFEVRVEDADATLIVDAEKVQHILLNLLLNAAKFTTTGSIDLHVRIDEKDLVAEVTDTGIGIEPTELERVFEPFCQIEQGRTRRAGGTGLGLSISRQTARLLGGDVTVESRPGEGSTFRLVVPRRGELAPE